MKLYNPYTKVHIEYPLDFNGHEIVYHIQHETLFCDRFAEWTVVELSSGDTLYIPYGSNMCPDVYVVTMKFITKQVSKPYGIYTVPMRHFFKTSEVCYEKIYKNITNSSRYIFTHVL